MSVMWRTALTRKFINQISAAGGLSGDESDYEVGCKIALLTIKIERSITACYV